MLLQYIDFSVDDDSSSSSLESPMEEVPCVVPCVVPTPLPLTERDRGTQLHCHVLSSAKRLLMFARYSCTFI